MALLKQDLMAVRMAIEALDEALVILIGLSRQVQEVKTTGRQG
jgi:hypothetical protein